MGRKTSRESEQPGLEDIYSTILEVRALQPRVAAAIRISIERLPDRINLAPADRRAVVALLDRVQRVLGVASPYLRGAPRVIDQRLAEVFGEPALGERTVYRALKALVEHTVLVEHPSRQMWHLRTREICDPSSPIHREFLAETPPLFTLGASVDAHDRPVSLADEK
ncbi:MAG: hypothetical protein H6711_14420 [Myxococcales bacterium]|nr:hypothetical protein [Myxococcales bacterium]